MSDIWSDEDISRVRSAYLKTKTVRETHNWTQEEIYDLAQECSSLWPIDYSKITDHPLNIKNFSFQKIAELKTDLSSITKTVLNHCKNINIYNLTVADWKAGSDDQKFLIKHGFDRETHSITVTEENYPEIYQIGKLFNFNNYSVAIQYQPPGSILPRHVDFLGSMWAEFNKKDLDIMNLEFDPITKSPKEYYTFRCMIALTDWYPGQVFGFEDQYWTNWKQGDVITFDWAHARHYTANASYSPRAYIKISGITKNKNHWIFNNLNTNAITQL
jgi:hypothetical protein